MYFLSQWYLGESTSTTFLQHENKVKSLMSSRNYFWSCSTDNECQTDFMAVGQYPQIKFPERGVDLQLLAVL